MILLFADLGLLEWEQKIAKSLLVQQWTTDLRTFIFYKITGLACQSKYYLLFSVMKDQTSHLSCYYFINKCRKKLVYCII